MLITLCVNSDRMKRGIYMNKHDTFLIVLNNNPSWASEGGFCVFSFDINLIWFKNTYRQKWYTNRLTASELLIIVDSLFLRHAARVIQKYGKSKKLYLVAVFTSNNSKDRHGQT